MGVKKCNTLVIKYSEKIERKISEREQVSSYHEMRADQELPCDVENANDGLGVRH